MRLARQEFLEEHRKTKGFKFVEASKWTTRTHVEDLFRDTSFMSFKQIYKATAWDYPATVNIVKTAMKKHAYFKDPDSQTMMYSYKGNVTKRELIRNEKGNKTKESTDKIDKSKLPIEDATELEQGSNMEIPDAADGEGEESSLARVVVIGVVSVAAAWATWGGAVSR